MRFKDSEQEKFTARAGDLLICEGGYPGRAAIWTRSEAIHFQKAIHRVRFHNARHTKWFLYFLYQIDSTGDIRKYFTGSGVQHFTGQSLAKVKVPIPPDNAIDQHVAEIEVVHQSSIELATICGSKLTHLTNLKQSLLHKAFTGELTADKTTADRTLSEALA